MSNFNSINNGGVPYYFPADIAKEGQQYARFSNWLKTRVNDNGKKVPVKWYDQGRVMNVNGLTPFIQGMVGHFTTDENDELIPSSDVVSRDWQGSTADVTDGGLAFYTLEDQFFCQEGQFKGVFGLCDGNGNVYTSVNIVFEILGNDLRMGETTKYYSSKLDKMLNEIKAKGNQVINDAKANYTAETQATREALALAQGSIQTTIDAQKSLSTQVAGMEQQINTQNIVTKKEFTDLSNQVTQQITQMKESGLEFFNTADDLRSTYPDGANKLCVTLNDSHQWVYDYTNHVWNDAGVYSYGQIDPKLLKALYVSNPDNIIPNSTFDSVDLWNIGRSATNPSYYVERTNKGNALVINGYVVDNSSNESWVTTLPFATTDVSQVSFGAEIAFSGIDYSNGSNVSIEFAWDMPDGSTSYYHRDIPSYYQDGQYHKISALHIDFPAGNPQTMHIGFVFYGNGQLKIRRPQANFGFKLNPYSAGDSLEKIAQSSRNLLLGQNVTDWDQTMLVPAQVIGNKDSSTTIDGTANPVGQYRWISSNLVNVSSELGLDLKLIASANATEDYGAYVEIVQFDQNQVELPRIDKYLPNSYEWETYSFKNINLDPATVYVQIRLVIKGQSKLLISHIEINQSYDTQSIHFPDSGYSAFEASPKLVVSKDTTITSHGKPTTKIRSAIDGFHGLASDYIPVTPGESISLRALACTNADRTTSDAFLEISQYDDKFQSQENNNIDVRVPASGILQELVANDIKLESTTKYIVIKAVVKNVVSLNIADLDYQFNQTYKGNSDNLFDTAQIAQGYTYTPKDVTITGNTLTISTRNKNGGYTALYSPMIRVEPGSTINSVINAKVGLLPDNQGSTYYELQQYNKYYDAVNNSTNLDNYFTDTKNQFDKFEFTNRLSNSTNWVRYALVVYGNADLQVNDVSAKYSQGMDTTNEKKLPQLYIQSRSNIPDKWTDPVPFKFIDRSRKVTGYVQFAAQGDSSKGYPKKNLKVKFFSDSQGKDKLKWKPKASWTKNHRFNIKANYIDATQARNIVNGQIVKSAYEVTPIVDSTVAKKLLKTQSLGQMEGFPIELYFDNGYYGLMTFNVKKDDKTFGMDSDNEEAITCETSASNLDDPKAKIDGQQYATVVQDKASDELNANWAKFLNFINTSTDEEFKASLSNYIDVNSLINLYLFGNWSHEWDFYNKSIIFLTYNSGAYFYAIPYDLDSTWNMLWNGSQIDSNLVDFAWIDGSDNHNKLLLRLYANFKSEIAAQWQKLRNSVWRNDQATRAFKEYIDAIPEEAYERDQSKWPDIPSKKITDYAQIQQSIIERGAEMDRIMNGLK